MIPSGTNSPPAELCVNLSSVVFLITHKEKWNYDINTINTTYDIKTNYMFFLVWGRRGRDHMIVGLTTTYAISAYHH